jgi:hypothetical protein
MTGRKSLTRMLSVAAVLAFVGGSARDVVADYFYGYAHQSYSSLALTGGTIGSFGTGSQSSAAQIGIPGGSEAHTDALDAIQSYVGPVGTRPAENLFTPLGQVNPDYIRGDSLISNAFGLSSVAEGYKVFPGTAAGSGSSTLSTSFTLTAPGTVTLTFNYSQLVSVIQSSLLGSVSASSTFDFNIHDALSGQTVFDSSPNALNTSFSLTGTGSAGVVTNSGNFSITSSQLTAGTYQVTITEGSRVFISNPVPEPSSLILIGLGLAGIVPFVRRKRSQSNGVSKEQNR